MLHIVRVSLVPRSMAGVGEDRIAFPGKNVCPRSYGGSGGRGWGSG